MERAADTPPSVNAEFLDRVITIRWSEAEGRPVYDIDEFDGWSAASIVKRVYIAIMQSLACPRAADEEPDDADIEEELGD